MTPSTIILSTSHGHTDVGAEFSTQCYAPDIVQPSLLAAARVTTGMGHCGGANPTCADPRSVTREHTFLILLPY
jgi:hypothetical protein